MRTIDTGTANYIAPNQVHICHGHSYDMADPGMGSIAGAIIGGVTQIAATGVSAYANWRTGEIAAKRAEHTREREEAAITAETKKREEEQKYYEQQAKEIQSLIETGQASSPTQSYTNTILIAGGVGIGVLVLLKLFKK